MRNGYRTPQGDFDYEPAEDLRVYSPDPLNPGMMTFYSTASNQREVGEQERVTCEWCKCSHGFHLDNCPHCGAPRQDVKGRGYPTVLLRGIDRDEWR